MATVSPRAPWGRPPADSLRAWRPALLVATARARPEAQRVGAAVAPLMGQSLRQAVQAALRRAPQRPPPWVALVDGPPTQRRRRDAVAAASDVHAA